METYLVALIVLGFIALSLLIVVLIYNIFASRRKNIVLKKADYLIEDLTYKSERLSSTIETVAKIANYVDIFETVTHKNIKSLAKVLARNKDDIYRILERLKKIAMGPQPTRQQESSTKTTKSTNQRKTRKDKN